MWSEYYPVSPKWFKVVNNWYYSFEDAAEKAGPYVFVFILFPVTLFFFITHYIGRKVCVKRLKKNLPDHLKPSDPKTWP